MSGSKDATRRALKLLKLMDYMTTIPWNNIDSISVKFDENLTVNAGLLTAAPSGNSAAATPPGTTVKTSHPRKSAQGV